jgi:glycosyltransferase involved in cell wall biosynthesis
MEDVTEHTKEYDVTVALLTHNAGSLLRRVLQAITTQETSLQVEILAIDSESTDNTVDLLREFDVRVISIPQEDFDFGRTRDQAFEAARGGIVVSVSQDAIPAHAHWLDHLVEPLTDPRYGASCGRSLPDPKRDEPQFAWERNGHF